MYCYLNGRFVKAASAKIPIQDRGFRYGDGLFETIAVYHSRPYQWDLHIARLKKGLEALEIPADISGVREAILKLLDKNKLTEATLRIAISRGSGSQGYLPIGCACPTILIEAHERVTPPANPSALWLSTYEKPSPQALPIACKTAQGLNATLVRMEASHHGCLDGLQLNKDGHITEASSANLFWKIGNVLYTPDEACGLLPGTTRAALMRLSPYEVKTGPYGLEILERADAVIVCNTQWQAMPIVELKPKGWKWPKSVELAQEMRTWLAKDIAHAASSA